MRKSDFNKEEHYAKGKTAQSRAETTEQQAPSGAGNKENTPLQFDVRIQSIRPGDSIKGTASVNINGAFAIRGVKIIEGSNGLFVSMPSYKAGNEYKDICFPITQECRKQLHEAVIGAYEQSNFAGAGYGSKASWDAGTGRTADGDGRNVTG
ncbi:MAG: SpoVG family protein [Roseburia intestinalis]